MASSSILGGSLAAQAQTSLMNSQQDRLISQLQSQGATPHGNAKIEKAAHEFEAMLLSNWLQQAEQSMATVPGADDNEEDGGGRDQMMSLGVQSLAGALTASGGIGIASMISRALQHAADKGNQPSPAGSDGIAKPHELK
jgi:Rod binding domain-containing protein